MLETYKTNLTSFIELQRKFKITTGKHHSFLLFCFIMELLNRYLLRPLYMSCQSNISSTLRKKSV